MALQVSNRTGVLRSRTNSVTFNNSFNSAINISNLVSLISKTISRILMAKWVITEVVLQRLSNKN